MIKSIAHGFGGLLRFAGRDTRAQFWPYAGLVFISTFLVFGAVLATVVGSSFAKIQAFALENPDQVTVTQGPGTYSISVDSYQPQLMPDFGAFFATTGLMIVTMVVLLAAAVTRRLHDRGRSGWWAFPIVVFLSVGVGGMSLLMNAFEPLAETTDATPDPAFIFGFIGLFANNILYLGWLLFLVFLLATDREAGPNRFGSRPAA